MWNDTDEPVAYFITFRTYGTWLHGDARGSVNRFRNKYKSDRLPKESKWLEVNAARLKSEPVLLNPPTAGLRQEGRQKKHAESEAGPFTP